MSAFSGRETSTNSSENLAPKPETENKDSLLSIYRRNSASSLAEVEGEAPSASKRNSRTKFSIFRRLSSVSSVGDAAELNSGDFSNRKEEIVRGSSQILAVQRRSSLLLDHDGCDRGGACQLVNCESYSRMERSCFAESSKKEKTCGLLPCLMALGDYSLALK